MLLTFLLIKKMKAPGIGQKRKKNKSLIGRGLKRKSTRVDGRKRTKLSIKRRKKIHRKLRRR